MNSILLYVLKTNGFGEAIVNWAKDKNVDCQEILNMQEIQNELLDGVIFFHESHSISKEEDELLKNFLKDNKVIHKVDLNGTLVATIPNFNLWVDRNRPKILLVYGNEHLVKNVKLNLFLEGIDVF